ncbi:ribose-5-phosphate isomerase RpiA [Tepidibacillus sp. LV47]|uniref:ribose-5-phosphate isomerase RpiA n=1 Tax=Tepidibacillus sp. LV47 TaxID=3398228 RepID=UPI003AB07CF0
MNAKQLAGEKAMDYIKDGMIVGLGTGSTVYWTIQKLGQLVKQGLNIKGIPTSKRTEELAKELGIPLTDFASVDQIDVTIDGADEIDSELNLIKGGGGALLREKIVAAASTKLIIVADESKLGKQLGHFPLPIEVTPFGWENTMKKIAKFGCLPQLRLVDDKPYITDNGNYILDCKFEKIANPEQLNKELNTIPGVVENGLFPNMADIVLIGQKDGKVNVITKSF